MTTTASASAKLILFGEHAVVYGRPAIAAPVHDLRAWASVSASPVGAGCFIEAPDLQCSFALDCAPSSNPLSLIVQATLGHLQLPPHPDLTIVVRSDIPVTRGMGSGAAVSAAIVRAIALFAGHDITAPEVSKLVYLAECLHHGTPSGIDNTVVALEQPIYFTRGQEPQPLDLGSTLDLVVADTGTATPTRVVVESVRQDWSTNAVRFDALFDDIGTVSVKARQALGIGSLPALGALMNENQRLLNEMGVSSSKIELLCSAARQAGALGAKLSGGGRGGITISLVPPEASESVSDALRSAGAVWCKTCHIRSSLGEERNGPS